MISDDIQNRTGARKIEEIPKEVLELINQGEIPTVNLTEWLAVNHTALVEHTFTEIGLAAIIPFIKKAIKEQKKSTAMSTTKLIGQKLYEYCAAEGLLKEKIALLGTHQADTIRCYTPFLISLNTTLTISAQLDQSRALAADEHFGVREVAWIAMRPCIEENLNKAIDLLGNWTKDENENIRRFTTESTRPRGVWCKHIEILKEHPEQALPILEPLRSDTSKYVQDSLGNWLNDASKSRPDFVIKLCERWRQESSTKETEKIIKKARRTIDKK